MSASSAKSAAAIVSSSWSGRLAPMIGDVIAGFASTHATASCRQRTRRPHAARPAVRRRSRTCASCQYRSWYVRGADAQREPGALGRRAAACLPVSIPPAIGLYGITPMRSSAHSGSSSRSIWRNSRLYRGCTDSKRARPSASLRPIARAIWYARKFEQPDVADLAGAHEVVERAAASRRSACSDRVRAAGRGRCSRCGAGAASRRSRPSTCLRELPLSHGRELIGPKHFVARITSSRRPGSQRPTISSVRPTDVPCAPERVDVGGVEERDPGLDGAVEDRVRRRFVALQTERHRAETEARHLKAGPPQPRVLHITSRRLGPRPHLQRSLPLLHRRI